MQEEQPKKGEASTGNRSTLLPGLRSARQRRGLTQRDLAALAGTGSGTISALEALHRGSYPKTTRRLAYALKTEVADLIEE